MDSNSIHLIDNFSSITCLNELTDNSKIQSFDNDFVIKNKSVLKLTKNNLNNSFIYEITTAYGRSNLLFAEY